jgi:hypothetical protein
MNSSEANEDQDRKLKEETDELVRSVGNVTLAWAHLDTSLAELLASIIGDRSHNHALAAAIYFAPGSLDVRLKVVDQAINAVMHDQPASDMTLPLWSGIHNRIKRQKDVRNAVAHGMIARRGPVTRPTGPRLVAPQKSPKFRKQLTDKTFGMSSADLKRHVTAVGKTLHQIQRLTAFINAWSSGDATASQSTYRALEEATQKGDTQASSADSQKPQE